MGTGAIRYLSTPRPVRVICHADGIPRALIHPGGTRRVVLSVRDEWLIQDRWWTDQPVERHYFEVLVDPGRVVTVFHDLREDEWFEH